MLTPTQQVHALCRKKKFETRYWETYVQSSTSPPVTMDCDTSENCLVTLFTKGGAVSLLTWIPPISSQAVLVYEWEAVSDVRGGVNDEEKNKSLTKA